MSEKASLKPARSKESTAHVLLVTVLLCLICSVLVTTAAVVLRPMQEYNKALDRKKNILRAAGLLEEGLFPFDDPGRYDGILEVDGCLSRTSGMLNRLEAE